MSLVTGTYVAVWGQGLQVAFMEAVTFGASCGTGMLLGLSFRERTLVSKRSK